jgi:hypothetical protein
MLAYHYHSTNPYRISKIIEYGTEGTEGNQLKFTYNRTTTKIADNKGLSNTYTFDDLGRTISTSSVSSDGKESYGQSYEYGNSKNNKNKLELETEQIKATNNIILNSSGENGEEHFNKINWGTNIGTHSVTQEAAYIGSKGFKINNQTKSNIFSFFFFFVPLEPNKTYTLSAYIQASISEYDYSNDSRSGILLSVSKIKWGMV